MSIALLSYFLGSCFLYQSFIKWELNNSAPADLLTISFLLLALSYFRLVFVKSELSNKLFYTSIFVALVSKLLLVFTPIILTGDVARYIFEGYVSSQGLNPYQIAPVDFANSHQLPTIWEEVEYKELSAIYPPVSILFFSLFAKSVLSWKFFLFLVEIVNFILIVLILKKENLPKTWSFIYLFSPLALVEISHSAHLEPLMICFVLMLLYLINDKKFFFNTILAALAAALAICTKYIPLCFLAIVTVKYLKEKKFKAAVLLPALSVVFSILIIYPFYGDSYLNSLIVYLQHWRFNDSIFHLLGWIFNTDWNSYQSFANLKKSLFLIWFIYFIFLLIKEENIYKISAFSLAAYLLLSSIFHPWYALWFLPFLCFYQNKALIFLTVTLLLSYQARVMGLDQVSIIYKLIEYLPVYALIIAGLLLPKQKSL